MKNFLLFLLGILINAFYMYVVLTIFFAAITAWLWLPIIFDISNCSGGIGLGLVLGIVILVVTTIVGYKLENVI